MYLDIDIEDIPDDRTVSLNIYLENCSPFYSISFGVSKDPRLEFYNDLKCFEKAEREILKPREPQQQNQDRGEILNLHSQPYPQIEGTSFDRVPPNIKIVEQPVAPRDIQPNIQIEERYCERHLMLPPIVQREFKLLTVRKIEVIF